jgi:hypothetical protein
MAMPLNGSPPREPKVTELFRDTLDGLGSLVASHFKLLRAELGMDARAYGRRVVRIALAIALLLVGYGLASVAAALALARVLGTPIAFLVVGWVNIVAAGIALRFMLARPAGPPLGLTRAELDQTVAVFTPERSPTDVRP